MSLIHDALKKAQNKENVQIGAGLSAFQEPVGGKKTPSSKRTIVLAAVLFVALGFFAYKRFFSNSVEPSPPIPSAGAPAGTAQGTQPVGGADTMKKKSVDAFKSDDLDTAWASIVAAQQLAPNDPEVWNNSGLIARKRGDMDAARTAYQKALDLKPEYPEALNNMAVLEKDQGNAVKARELFEKALKIQPSYPEANFNLALLYDNSGDKTKAAEYYKRFLEVSGAYSNNIVEAVRDRIMEIEPQ